MFDVPVTRWICPLAGAGGREGGGRVVDAMLRW